MYSPNINMVVSSDKIIAFRFLSSQKSNQSSWDLLMIRFARLPAAFVAAAIGPGRSGLRRCCQGELACLTSASIRGREARSGLRVRWRWRSDRAAFPGAEFWESKAFSFLLLLAENYNQTTNDPTTETQSAQRTHRDFIKKEFLAVYSLTVLAGRGQASPGSRSWPPP